MKRLQGKVAVVTGAASGIGKAIATLFAKEGAIVIATDINLKKLKEWADEIDRKHDMVIKSFAHDVTMEKEWQAVIYETLYEYRKIDILVNNAGIFPAFLATENTDKAIWEKVINTNLEGVFLGCKTVIPSMKKNNCGAIVNISSIAGMAGGAGIAYSASKGGVRLISKDLATELGNYNIRVNSIMPGAILTNMTSDLLKDPNMRANMQEMSALKRIGKPEEIAFGALFLASDEASFVTGADLVIDGGCLASYS